MGVSEKLGLPLFWDPYNKDLLFGVLYQGPLLSGTPIWFKAHVLLKRPRALQVPETVNPYQP